MRQIFIIKFKDDAPEESCGRLYDLLLDYLEEKGNPDLAKLLPRMSRVWIDTLTTPAGMKCVGFMTLTQVWDMSSFHCEDDRSRARLMQRAAIVLEENAGQRTAAMVYVDPEVEDKWIPMLEAMGAKRANRWLVPAGAELQEGGKNVLRPDEQTIQLHGPAEESDSSADHETGRGA